MEVNKNEHNGWYCAHCQRGVDPSEVTYHEAHSVCGRYITDDEPPKVLSELEIVQKALDKTDGKLGCSNSYSEVIDPFGKVLFDDCHESLLTWAKQTIGID